MRRRALLNPRGWIASTLLIGSIVATGAGLAIWKYANLEAADAAAASQPEPMESVTAAVATERGAPADTTSIGTVLALRSITLRNELAGTVRRAVSSRARSSRPGALLVALDVSVEQAELEALEAQAALAQTTLDRLESLRRAPGRGAGRSGPGARRRATWPRRRSAAPGRSSREKTIRAPFRARVGIADVHPGQYLNEGTELTTLQGVADGAHVDFTVAQRVAARPAGGRLGGGRRPATMPRRSPPGSWRSTRGWTPTPGTRRCAPAIAGSDAAPSPGASVRVAGAGRAAGHGGGGAGERAAQGARRRPRLRDRAPTIRASRGPTSGRCESGTVVGDTVLILDGLAAGEQVATSGSFKLREAVLVAVAGSVRRAADHWRHE